MPGWKRRTIAILATMLAVACTNMPPDETNYVAQTAAARAAKDAAFSSAKDGDPIPLDKRAELLPLPYFPIDPEYKVPSALKPSADRTIIDMPTSTGTNRKMRRAGTLEFTLKGQPQRLTAFVEVGSDPSHLFVPFSDLTSGTETYPAGRFMDLDRNATGLYEIDFNRAYHPYCYYNPTWECPYPPAENRLRIPVRAGERLKK